MDRSVLNACPGISLSRASLLPHALALPCGYGWRDKYLSGKWQCNAAPTPHVQLPAAAVLGPVNISYNIYFLVFLIEIVFFFLTNQLKRYFNLFFQLNEGPGVS